MFLFFYNQNFKWNPWRRDFDIEIKKSKSTDSHLKRHYKFIGYRFFLVILQYSICSDIYVIFRDSPINKYFVWSQRSICTPKFKSKKKINDNKNHTQTHICTCVWTMSRQKLNIKKNLGQKTIIVCVSVIIQVSERNTC